MQANELARQVAGIAWNGPYLSREIGNVFRSTERRNVLKRRGAGYDMTSSVLCRMCGRHLESNGDLDRHLISDHSVTLQDYYGSHPEATRRCSKCHRELTITRFYVDRSTRSGYRTQCIDCLRPGAETRECPVCHRMFQPSGMVTHLKRAHGIRPSVAYREYLGGKRCPRCEAVKPLREFYKLRRGDYSAYCKKCNSDRQRKYRSRKP